MGDAKDGAVGFVGKAFDFPAVGEDDLLYYRQSQARAIFLSREIGFKNLGAALGRNARAVVAQLENSFGGAALLGDDLDFAALVNGLDGIEQQVEKGLAEELLVSVITGKRAYEELEREGIIFRRQGLGTFVSEQGHDRSRETKLAAAKDLLRDGFREAAEAGLKPSELADLAREILKNKR